MTAIDRESAADRAAVRRKIVRVGALAAVGAAIGAVAGYASDHWFDVSGVGWPDLLAGFIGLVCLASAAAAVVAILQRKPNVPSGCAWMQVATLALAGLMLFVPMLAPAGSETLAFAGLVVLFALQTAANLRLWRIGDELLRRVIIETGAVSFWSLQAALFLYAGAERLSLVPTVSAWGLTGILMTAYVLASSVVAFRRGFS